MSFNNATLLKAIDDSNDPIQAPEVSVSSRRRRVVSAPCLPQRLPTSSVIQREAQQLAPQEFVRQMVKVSMEESTDSEVSSPIIERSDTRYNISGSPRPPSSIRSLVKSLVSPRASRSPTAWSNVQSYEVMKAIEEKDIMFLMEVRDRAFPLLLQSSGSETPLVHAIRTGNKDVAIVLLGAFSRWVNYLEDSDVQKPQTQSYLKALRIGLKLAINEGLAKSQSELIASFMQTLIMSEGDKWVWAQVSLVSRALNAGTEGKPVQVAGAAVRRFATKELGKADLIASFEDYVSNATADLLMMGAWANVLESVNGELIPSYYFARDDRVYKAFVDRLHLHKSQIQRTCGRRLQWQLQVLKAGLEGRSVTFRRKIETLSADLDEGAGV